MPKILIPFLSKLPVFRFMVFDIPSQHNINICKKKLIVDYTNDIMKCSDARIYFWERTGPDFMHPVYTLGFD